MDVRSTGTNKHQVEFCVHHPSGDNTLLMCVVPAMKISMLGFCGHHPSGDSRRETHSAHGGRYTLLMCAGNEISMLGFVRASPFLVTAAVRHTALTAAATHY